MPRGSRASDPLELRIVDDLPQLARALRDVDPVMRRQLPARLRRAARPVTDEAERIKPSRRIKIGVRSSLARRGAGVRIVARSPEKPELAPLLEAGSQGSGGRYIRHPVFGRHVRVNQPTRPYLRVAGARKRPEVVREITRVVDDVERAVGRR